MRLTDATPADRPRLVLVLTLGVTTFRCLRLALCGVVEGA